MDLGFDEMMTDNVSHHASCSRCADSGGNRFNGLSAIIRILRQSTFGATFLSSATLIRICVCLAPSGRTTGKSRYRAMEQMSLVFRHAG
jgi:hypothetical protein